MSPPSCRAIDACSSGTTPAAPRDELVISLSLATAEASSTSNLRLVK